MLITLTLRFLYYIIIDRCKIRVNNDREKEVRNKSVAVLNIRSSEICAVVAEKGVNNTFIIKSKCSRSYEGYAEGQLLDTGDFASALSYAFMNIIASVNVPVKRVYVGVPDEFVTVYQTDKSVSFSGMQKIGAKHLRMMEDDSLADTLRGEAVVRCAPLFYILSDKRRLIDPTGMASDSLRARLSYFTVKTEFIDAVKKALSEFPAVKEIRWLPQSYAQTNYLLSEEQRDSYRILFDLGFISSTFSVACGGGIAFNEAFSVGVGHVAVLLMEALDVPYEVALALMKKVNLNARDTGSYVEEFTPDGTRYKFPASDLRELIREGLDGICEMIDTCIQSFALRDLTGAPILVTGEGVNEIRGIIEHLISRLVTPFEVIAPKLPYYDKPQFSSLFGLVSTALSDEAQ